VSGFDEPGQTPPTEEELRAAYEAELARIRVEQVLLEGIVTLINLGMRRAGLAPGTEGERDPEQVRIAIEAVRAHLPLVEQLAPQQAKPIRDALSQLQLAYVRIGGAAAPPESAAHAPEAAQEPPPAKPGEAGPAQKSGRLWVPGQ
jgi:hypothetical protein